MKYKLTAALIVLSFLVSSVSIAYDLPPGLIVKIKMDGYASSEESQPGQIIPMIVADDVISGGEVVIRKGERVRAIIADVTPRDGMMRPGRIKIDILSTQAVNGENVRLRGYAADFPKEKYRNLFCPSIACAAKKGKEAVIERGAIFEAFIEE